VGTAIIVVAVEDPYIIIGQIASVCYFLHFLIFSALTRPECAILDQAIKHAQSAALDASKLACPFMYTV
jgi:hypothetical protein